MPEAGGCPCGQPVPLALCCGPLVAGQRAALTAEELMRSRYTAFALGVQGAGHGAGDSASYLLHSWDPDTRPSSVDFEDDRRWIGLEVHETVGGGAFDTTGTVRFTATYVEGRATYTQSELSTFRRLERRWVYVGVVVT